jgi:DNA-binding IclR family transcriptional regulator
MVENGASSGINSVGSVETLFDIIEHIHQADGATLSAIAAELDYAKSTVHRHLATLEQRGYVVNDDGYHVGLRFLELGEDARNRRRGYQLAKDKVEELAQETAERAQFLVEEHAEAVYIHRALGSRAVRTDPGIGKRVPLHATASGKAMLAAMPSEKVSRIIEQTRFVEVTDETITDAEELRRELAEIRDRGYAFNREENLDVLHAVGVPVEGSDGGVIGGLSVSGPSHRFTGERFEDELLTLLLGAANELELNIAHS